MSDSVTFELDCALGASELERRVSEFWQGESVDVAPPVSTGMRWLVVLNYYYHGSDARPEQRSEIENVIRYLLRISRHDYIYYYRSSSTVEFAGLEPDILEPSSIFDEKFEPKMISGFQAKHLLVEDQQTAVDLPDIQLLSRWRLGCTSRRGAEEIRKDLEREVQGGEGVINVELSFGVKVTVSFMSKSIGREKKLLKVLQFMQRESPDGIVFYFPWHGSNPWKLRTSEPVGPDTLFDDEFRLGAEKEPLRRYPIHRGSAGGDGKVCSMSQDRSPK